MRVFIKKSTFFEYVIALAIVLDCNSVWNNLIETRSWFQFFVFAMLVAGVLGFVFVNSRMPKNALIISGAVLLYYLLFLLLNANSVVRAMIHFSVSCALIVMYNIVKKNKSGEVTDLLVCFKNITLFIAVVSLAFWLVGSVMGLIQPTGSSLTNWTGNANQTMVSSYFGVYYSYQSISFFGKLYIVRNIAIFNEAPMASLCFSLGFMIELLCCDKWKIKNCVILAAAILSTFSTTGYIIVIVMCVYKYMRSSSRDPILKLIKVLSVPVLFCTILILANILIQEKLSTYSGMARSDDWISGVQAWLMHPLFGDGVGSLRAMSLVRPSWRKAAEGFNSGLIQVLVQGGIYLAFPYIFVPIKALKDSLKSRNYDKVMFVMMFCFIFCVTVIAYTYLAIMLLCFLALYGTSDKEGKLLR